MAKNSNKFDLNKTSERKFDLGKGKERKFDLSKDVEDTGTPLVSSEFVTSQSKKKWPYFIGALIIIALLVCGLLWYFGNLQNQNSQDEPIVIEVPENISEDSIAVVNDSIVIEDEEGSNEESDVDSQVIPTNEDMPGIETESKTEPVNDSNVDDGFLITENNSIPEISQKVSSNVITVSDIEQKALEVIRGNFGNGKERKEKLGSEYSVIQNKVNELYRERFVR